MGMLREIHKNGRLIRISKSRKILGPAREHLPNPGDRICGLDINQKVALVKALTNRGAYSIIQPIPRFISPCLDKSIILTPPSTALSVPEC